MIFSFYEVANLPVAVIDNLYDSTEVEKIWQELCFLNNDPTKFYDPQDTGSATIPKEDGTEEFLKQNKALSLDSTFLDRSISSILQINRKIFLPDVTDSLIEKNVLFRHLSTCDADGTLVSYYENSDYYLPHKDNATLTALTWFYNSPKKFDGGDVTFEHKLKIECKFNRCVIFPSILLHESAKISMNTQDLGKNQGKYTISQFLGYKI